MFVSRLVENVRTGLRGLGAGSVRALAGRIVVELGDARASDVVARLRVIPGVANLFPARRCEPTLAALEANVAQLLAVRPLQGSFRVDVRRADKRFPLTSPEIGAHIGGQIVRATGARVDLSSSDEVVRIVIVEEAIYVSTERKIAGCGGLPVSTGGRLLLLLSGGIDSPVAGLRMMRRGCRIAALHFHSVPYLDRSSQDKVRQLCGVLARGQGSIRLSMVAFGDIQRAIVQVVPAQFRVVLYRRMMLRIASAVAREDEAAGIVTGDSLGQVASQTLANLRTIELAAPTMLLRPLLGMDKLEIVRYAQHAGTYEISISPDQDCCSLFVPKHPGTAVKIADAERAEAMVDLAPLLESALAARTQEWIESAWETQTATICGSD
jgi:thiamine biosynthesis protein ThiI